MGLHQSRITDSQGKPGGFIFSVLRVFRKYSVIPVQNQGIKGQRRTVPKIPGLKQLINPVGRQGIQDTAGKPYPDASKYLFKGMVGKSLPWQNSKE